ncbi:MAG TPA: macro domain-containing protein [Burkholderiales bacterium]|nr:macro domain-containing protein [Burkholderiales bacterium]
MVRGDLLAEPVDAIVNAANGHLAHGGGVAGIIARAAGARTAGRVRSAIGQARSVPDRQRGRHHRRQAALQGRDPRGRPALRRR